MKIKINSDVYCVSSRIRLIDSDYYIVYDTLKNAYYVMSKKYKTIEYTLPFNELDERSINYVLEMKNKSNFKIFEEINKDNEEYKKEINKKIINSAINCAEKRLKEQK